MKKKVLLVYAGAKCELPRFPLSCLALAAYIKKHGYEPEILDLRLDSWKNKKYGKYLAIGISAMTGDALNSAIRISKHIKSTHNKKPIIWGGHHASALPDQCLKEPYVDSVIMGEGEKALLNALKDIEKNKLKPKYNQNIIRMSEVELPDYNLIDITKYLDYKDGWSYEIARGCPHNCAFCYVHYFHHNKWRFKPASQVAEEISELVNKYKIKHLKIIGDNFFVNKEYALRICKFIKTRQIEWSSTCRADYFSKFTKDDMLLLKESGCKILQIGAESGNQEILDFMKKGITPYNSVNAAKLCNKYGIVASFSLMIGVPGEGMNQIKDTLRLYDELRKYSEVMGIFIYSPYPGTPMYQHALDWDYLPPESLEDWASIKLKHEKMPWHDLFAKELITISQISRFNYFMGRFCNNSAKTISKKLKMPIYLVRLGMLPFRIIAKIRWKLKYFNHGIEWNLFFKLLSYFTERY